jgi:uncharacterized protein YlzI (FlbEa/FlbD family)
MLIDVLTMEGAPMVINSDQIIICGPVNADGQPMIGMTKVLMLGGAALIVREGVTEFKERVNAEATGRSRVSL